MSSDDRRKIVLNPEVDASGAKQGFGEIKQSGVDAADALSKSFTHAGMATKGVGEEAKKTAESLTRAERSAVSSLERMQAALSSTSKSGYLEKIFELRGIDASKPKIAELLRSIKETEAAQAALRATSDAVAASTQNAAATLATTQKGLVEGTKAYNAALRQVPAQITDIVVGLQGGQAPMTVLLQQGGQLRDVFGSIGGASRALLSTVVGLVNPYTAAAAALAAVAYGYYEGSKEADMFRKALIETGGASGVTAGQLIAMSVALDKLGTTQGRAAESLATFVQQGISGAQALERFTLAAIRLEDAGGASVKETAKAFADLGKDPLKATIRLNESMNYLTLSTYEQIKALEEQGRSADAAKVAQEAYATGIERNTAGMVANLGYVESAWLAIVKASKEALDVVKSIGREKPAEQVLLEMQQRKANAEQLAKMAEGRGQGVASTANAELDKELARLSKRVMLQMDSAQLDQQRLEIVKAKIEWDKREEGYLSNTQKLQRDINKEVAEGNRLLAAGAITVDQWAKRMQDASDKLRDKKEPKKASDSYGRITSDIQKFQDEAQQYLDTGKKLDESDKFRIETLAKISEAWRKGEITLSQAVDAESAMYDAQQKRVAVERELLRLKGVAAEMANRKQDEDELNESLRKQQEIRTNLAVAMSDMNRATKDANDLMDLERSLLGATAKERAIAIAQFNTELELRKELEKVNNAIYDTEADREYARQQARAAIYAKGAAAIRKIEIEEFQRVSDSIQNGLTDAFLNAVESGKDIFQSFGRELERQFRTLILRPVVSAVMNPIAQVITGAVTSGTAAAGTADAAGSAINATSALNSLGTMKSWLTDFGGGVASQVSKLGNYLSTFSNSTVSEWGIKLTENASAIGQYAQTAGNALGYLNAAVAASRGEWGKAIGTGVGTYFGGPIGAMIGGAIGGAIDKAFGGGVEYTVARGIQGRFGLAGFSGRSFTDVRNDGNSGLFGLGASGASSKTVYSALDAKTTGQLSGAFAAMQLQTAQFAQALGLSAGTVMGFSKDIRLELTNDAEANKKAIAALFEGMANEAAATVLDPKYIREGETASKALSRLAINLGTVNASFDLLGKTLLEASAASGDTASKLVDAFGGSDKYTSAIGTYYQKFYTEEERLAKTREQLQQQFNALGLSMPDTLKAYRDLVDAQDVTTEAGLRAYTALINVSSAFADVTNASTDFALKIADAFKDISKSLGDLINSIAGQRAKNAGAIDSIAGPLKITVSSILAGIDSALSSIVAPSTAAVVNAVQRKINADAAVVSNAATMATTGNAASIVNTATTNKTVAGDALARITADLTAARQQLAVTPPGWTRQPNNPFQSSYFDPNPDYAALVARVNGLSSEQVLASQRYADSIANLNQVLATYGTTAAQNTAATNAYNAALAERKAAEDAIVAAQNAYTAELRAYVLSASTGLEKLATLREKTLDYYKQQQALANLMATSAANLRQSLKDSIFNSLTPDKQQAQLQADFANAFALAQVSSGEALAGYADQLAALLPRVTSGLMDTATSATDYARLSAQFSSQITTIADKLDAQTPADYLQQSVDLLNLIDAKMAALDATSQSAQALIVAAIDAGSLRTADGLKQVINALQGKPVSAFASGGYYPGGLALVGEQGPELINFANPGQVYTAAQTSGMFASGSDTTAEEVRAMRADLRAAQVQTAALMQRLVKINEKWDGDGLPSTRVETA